MKDRRSKEAADYRKLYRTTAWKKGRALFLEQHPLCERCEAQGTVAAASVVHHRDAHKGDLDRFYSASNWQAVCKPCHDRDIQSEERTGFSRSIGADGWPTDDRHPANRPGAVKSSNDFI